MNSSNPIYQQAVNILGNPIQYCTSVGNDALSYYSIAFLFALIAGVLMFKNSSPMLRAPYEDLWRRYVNNYMYTLVIFKLENEIMWPQTVFTGHYRVDTKPHPNNASDMLLTATHPQMSDWPTRIPTCSAIFWFAGNVYNRYSTAEEAYAACRLGLEHLSMPLIKKNANFYERSRTGKLITYNYSVIDYDYGAICIRLTYIPDKLVITTIYTKGYVHKLPLPIIEMVGR